MCTYCKLRIAAIDRSRRHLFGDDAVLQIFETTPADGDKQLAEIETGWRGRRIETTTNAVAVESGEWQFEIAAGDDWADYETYMFRASAVVIDGRRWTVTKVEQPIGKSQVWRLKAETQR